MSEQETIHILPALPIKNTLLFPHLQMPLSIGRPASLAAVEAALASEEKQIIIVAQHDASVETPSQSDLYTIGTRAIIKKSTRPRDGMLELVVAGGTCRRAQKSNKPPVSHGARATIAGAGRRRGRGRGAASRHPRAGRQSPGITQPQAAAPLPDADQYRRALAARLFAGVDAQPRPRQRAVYTRGPDPGGRAAVDARLPDL